MQGIRILTDENGHKFVEIDLQIYGELWEDLFDALVIRERAGEKREPWSKVENRLIRTGKIRGSLVSSRHRPKRRKKLKNFRPTSRS